MHKIAIFLLVFALFSGCATHVGYASKASSLQMGMSKEQVFSIMGQPKKASARSDDGKLIERFSWWSPKMVGFTPVDNEVLSTDRLYVKFVDGRVSEWGDSYDFGAATSQSLEAQAEMMKNINRYYKAPPPEPK